jgi:hypothetical protein
LDKRYFGAVTKAIENTSGWPRRQYPTWSQLSAHLCCGPFRVDHAQVLDNSARAFRPPFVHRSTPEYQPGRVLIDVFDRLVQLGKGTAAIDGEGLEFLEA